MKPSPVPSPAWAAGFVDRHPAFAIHRLLPVDTWIDWPTPAALTALLAARGVRNAAGRPVQIDIAVQESGAAGYERRILEAGRLAVRPGWHDLFNGLAWALFPHAKAALNARHVADLAEHGASQRSRVRDALTAFDEDGVILATSDAVLADHVRRFRWKDLFWHERQRLPGAFDVFVFGHGLAEKLLNPFVGLTAKAVIVDVEPAFFSQPLDSQLAELDDRVAARLRDADDFPTPRVLAPFPILGMPGWWPAAAQERFYADTGYFRPGRRDRAARDAYSGPS